jgi:hypothetical protein
MNTQSLHLLVATTLLLSASCTADKNSEAIDREVFVEVYSDLRIAAVETDSGSISFSGRDSILDAFDVTEQDLTLFLEAHVEDLEFMRDVWNDIELRMDRGDQIN